MNVLAIDPGETTGIVWIKLHKHEEPEIVSSADIPYVYLHTITYDIAMSAVVIMEDAVKTGAITKGKVFQLKAMGWVEQQASHESVTLEYIQPSQTKSIKDAIPDKIRGHHAKDAYRVFLAWARRQ